MRNRFLGLFLICFLSSGAWAAPVESQWIGAERVPNLQIQEVIARPYDANFETIEVIVKGVYRDSDPTLVVDTKKVRLKKDGTFQVRLFLPNEENLSVGFHAIDSYGKIQNANFRVLLDSENTHGATHWSFAMGLSFTEENYSEGDTLKYSAKSVTFKGGVGYRFSKAWKIHANLFTTALTLSKSLPAEGKFLGVNTRVGRTYRLSDVWDLTPYVGYYYTTMSVADDSFGFSGLAGPQVFLSAGMRMKNDTRLDGTVKFSPVAGKGSIYRPLNNREIALGIAYTRPFSENGRPWTFTVDFAQLKLSLFGAPVESRSLSLGFMYPIDFR